MDGKTNIQVSRLTRDKLVNLGSKGDSYDDIITVLIHEHFITLIRNVCGDGKVTDLESQSEEVFYNISYELPTTFVDSDGVRKEWNRPDKLHWACEMATDEDFVGHNREPNLSEAIINVYCLLEGIPAPTWSFQRINPFARF